MKDTIKLGLTLLIIAAISGAVLAGMNGITGPIIAEMERESTFGAFFEIFEEAEDFKDIEESLAAEIKENNSAIEDIFEAVDGSENSLGYVIKAKSGGYGGDMFLAIGIDNDGLTTGMKVVGHSETPGIGDKIEAENFTSTFIGKETASDLKAVAAPAAEDEVQLLSGSTVSTNAVMGGVNKALDAYRTYLAN